MRCAQCSWLEPELAKIAQLVSQPTQVLELFRVELLGLESGEAICGEEMLLEGNQWWKHSAVETGSWLVYTGPWLFVFVP